MNKRIFLNFILFLLLSAVAFGVERTELYLRDNLKKAHQGDFIVTMTNKNYTILNIHDIEGNSLVIEEITVPESKMGSMQMNWKDWIEQGAPQHTSWVIYEINLQQGQMQEFFSFTKNGWCEIAQADNFLSTLLNLQMQRIPDNQRKKIGPRSSSSEIDQRSLWQPRMIVDGQQVEGVIFDAWRARWPKDGSELADKSIEVYLPREEMGYPMYFPYWLQISGKLGKAKVRIVDSGSQLVSPKSFLPRRPPEFLGSTQTNDGRLLFTLKTRPYYHAYELFTEENKTKELKPIPFRLYSTDTPQIVILEVTHDDLNMNLKAGNSYRFLIKPREYHNIWAEAKELLEWP